MAAKRASSHRDYRRRLLSQQSDRRNHVAGLRTSRGSSRRDFGLVGGSWLAVGSWQLAVPQSAGGALAIYGSRDDGTDGTNATHGTNGSRYSHINIAKVSNVLPTEANARPSLAFHLFSNAEDR